jgi:hypothetical protein
VYLRPSFPSHGYSPSKSHNRLRSGVLPTDDKRIAGAVLSSKPLEARFRPTFTPKGCAAMLLFQSTNNSVLPHQKDAGKKKPRANGTLRMGAVVCALVLLSALCAPQGRAQTIHGTRSARVERGTVKVSALPRYSPTAAAPSETQEETPSHASAPEFPVPHGMKPRLSTITAASTSTASVAMATTGSFNTLTSPAPTLSFLAQTRINHFPPDTNGAVSLNFLMSATNDEIVIQNRLGAVLTTTSLNAFWSSVWPDINPAWDPRVSYDPYADRWIFVCMANWGGVGSSLLAAVSATSDPTGTWYLRRVFADPTNSTTFDHPRVGFNSNWIVATGNELSDSDFSWLYSVVYAFDKTDFYSDGTKAPVQWSDITNAFTITPALTYDPTIGTMYMLANYNGNDTTTAPPWDI